MYIHGSVILHILPHQSYLYTSHTSTYTCVSTILIFLLAAFVASSSSEQKKGNPIHEKKNIHVLYVYAYVQMVQMN
jgi:hypothetical protein